MVTPNLIIRPCQSDHHSRLRARLEQKTLSILDAPGREVDSLVKSVELYAEALGDIGAIDSDLRREYSCRARCYGSSRIEHLTNHDTDETLSILGIGCFTAAFMILACFSTFLAIYVNLYDWFDDKTGTFIDYLVPPAKFAGWLIVLGLFWIYSGSGFKSALQLVKRWKYPIILYMLVMCFIVIGGWVLVDFATYSKADLAD